MSKSKPRRKRKAEPGRVGTKKFDTRWRDEDGNVWPSKHECDVYTFLREAGHAPTRCAEGRDSFPYTTNIRGGYCISCGAKSVGQKHVYTPDIHLPTAGNLRPSAAGGCYVEAKGYLRAGDRRILRGVLACNPDLNLLLVLQRYHAATIDWAKRFLKVPIYVLSKNNGLVEQ